MNIYKLLQLIGKGSIPSPVKLLGLWIMHVFHKRTIGIFIDPVMSCNLRCMMCYFSDPERRSQLHGIMSDDQISQAEKALFHRALKLQIGCGAEPTLYSGLSNLVTLGKRAGIPYISLTTNGQLLATGKVNLRELVNAGLNEITLSMHGTTEEIYEKLMPGASYTNLLTLISSLRDIKAEYPEFIIRVNYTVNSLNMHDLEGDKFWHLWPGDAQPDVVQLRPVQNLGHSAWKDFDMQPLIDTYQQTIGNIKNECRRRGITCIAPSLSDMGTNMEKQDRTTSIIEDITYCYISPELCYKGDFKNDDTYESYHKRHHTFRAVLRAVISNRSEWRDKHVTKKLNYRIE